MDNHFKAEQLLERKQPRDIGLACISVQRIEVNGACEVSSGSEEVCLVCICGTAGYDVGGMTGTAVVRDMLYVPRQTTITLSGIGAVMMRYGAPSDGMDTHAAHLKFADIDADPVRHKIFGKRETGCLRNVWQYIDADFPCSRLMMGICTGENGGWTAWPPHEHAEKREEVYVYFDMGSAFGIQCVYDDMDRPYTVAMVREGDMISIPRGYHPNCGCPGKRISYVYCMAAKKPGDRNFMDLHVQEEFGEKFE